MRIALTGLAALVCAGATPPPEWQPRTVASYPNGTFLENLSVAPGGTLYFTSYLDRELLAWDGKAAPTRFAALPAHPVGILAEPDGFVVTAHGSAFTTGDGFTATNRVLLLDRAGKVTRTIAAPDARFLNGLVRLSPTRVLLADSIAGTIWALDPTDGAITPWLRDATLAVDPAVTPFRPGANGLKLHRGALYVSNSSRGTIHRIALSGGAPVGAPVVVVAPGPVDDFAFEPDGAIVATTHGDTLLRIAADGTVAPIMTEGCDACTSVARLSADRLVVLTTGSMLEGGKAPARVLELTRR